MTYTKKIARGTMLTLVAASFVGVTGRRARKISLPLPPTASSRMILPANLASLSN